MSTRTIQLVGPYRDIWRELMSHDPMWRPGEDEDEDLPFYEWSLEGPAGTGKTFFEGVLLEAMHQRYPRMRSVVIRKTRVSLTDSWMQVFEDDVLGPDHPILLKGPSRAHRNEYSWDVRQGQSVTRIAGMDNPTRLFSTQYDFALVVEGIEFKEDEYQSLYRAMRNSGTPFKGIITDTNPGNTTHFLNRRPDREGTRMERVKTKHWHNPAYFNPTTKKWTAKGRQYMMILDQLSGVMRRRLKDGEWCSAEGAIYPHFDEAVHVFDPGEPTEEMPHGINALEYDYFMGGIDFGHLDATDLQVWGVCEKGGIRYVDMLAEWYGAKVRLETMAEWVKGAFEEFGFVKCVADHRTDLIEYLNEQFGWRKGQDGHNLVQKAQKGKGSVSAGIELVKDLMGDPDRDRPTVVRFSSRALRYECPIHRAQNLPVGVVEEIPGYVWAEQKEDRPAKNEPDPGCVDHGCDAMRYILTEIWKTKYGRRPGTLEAAQAFKQENIDKMSAEEFGEYVEKYGDT